jgi:hypothetical protein
MFSKNRIILISAVIMIALSIAASMSFIYSTDDPLPGYIHIIMILVKFVNYKISISNIIYLTLI